MDRNLHPPAICHDGQNYNSDYLEITNGMLSMMVIIDLDVYFSYIYMKYNVFLPRQDVCLCDRRNALLSSIHEATF